MARLTKKSMEALEELGEKGAATGFIDLSLSGVLANGISLQALERHGLIESKRTRDYLLTMSYTPWKYEHAARITPQGLGVLNENLDKSGQNQPDREAQT